MSDTTLEYKLSLLIDSLQNLSKPYEEQINSFPDYVDVFDEVLSDFGNAFRLLPAIMDEQAVSYEAVKEILKCKNLIELNLSIEEKQTDESFATDKVWSLVRETAANVLSLL